MRSVVLAVLFASLPARADSSLGRIGATAGYQQTDRAAWVFGPALEVRVHRDISIRGEAQLELGDLDDPFGHSNILSGNGPHVNHVMFGPMWRPAKYARYDLAAGAELGVLVMHSVFAAQDFTKRPALGLLVQAGKLLGPISLGLQLRLDLSTTVAMGNVDGSDTPTTTGRLNLVVEFPVKVH